MQLEIRIFPLLQVLRPYFHMSGKRLKCLKLKYIEVLPLAKPDAVFVNDQQFHFRVIVLD